MIGSATEASRAETTPAQRPPLTAATVTASMKIATSAEGPSPDAREARIAPARVAITPIAMPRRVIRAMREGVSATIGRTVPPASRPFTPARRSQHLHALSRLFHAVLTADARTLLPERGSVARIAWPSPLGGPCGRWNIRPLSSEPVFEAGSSLQLPASRLSWARGLLDRVYPSRSMHVLIMGCGRVGSELSNALLEGGNDVTVIDKNPDAFWRHPPGEGAKQIVGLGFDRALLEDAGIRDADAFIAVSSGDNSNIVSARVALEHFHVPKVVARIYDPRRAEIYGRLNIPTVATTTWGIRQIQLMLLHDREEIRESLGGGDILRVRVPVPEHLVGKPANTLNVEGKILVAGVSRGGTGFLPTPDSTLQQGDFLIVMMVKDGLELLDEQLEAPSEHH